MIKQRLVTDGLKMLKRYTTQVQLLLGFGFILAGVINFFWVPCVFAHPDQPTQMSSNYSNARAGMPGIRLKDIVDFEGVRENQLVGYGLVVGLNKTGDSIGGSPFTEESLKSMLERLGINVRDKTLTGNNVAAVMVTANLPPFARKGTRIDVNISSIGSAKDLRGGTLLVTPLMGADGEVYAVSQGPVATGGFQASGQSNSSVTKGVPTSGKIANGAIIEREIAYQLAGTRNMQLSLRNPDSTTARRIADSINGFMHESVAMPIDPSTVSLNVPARYQDNILNFMADIEQLRVNPDQIAKVVIDESNGVIVMGENVKISPVAISHGNLTIRVTETPQVSQPNPFSTTGVTALVDRSDIEINSGSERKLTVLKSGVSLQDMVNALNALGVGPLDMITILRTIKAAGALQAEIEVM